MKDCKLEKFPPSGMILYCNKEDLFELENNMVTDWWTEVHKSTLTDTDKFRIDKYYDYSILYERREDYLFREYYKQEIDPNITHSLDNIIKFLWN